MAGLFSAHCASQKGEVELQSELELMLRVFESVVNGVSISDARLDDMPLVYVNPAFERMTGYSREEVLGRNCRFLQGDETGGRELAELRKALREHRQICTVLKNFTKEGAVFWNELHLSPVFDSEGRLTHYVGIQNDITNRVELKRQMEHMALHDSLTGLANRTLLMDRLQLSLERSRRQNLMTAVFFLDLDGFKAINDRHGHDGGDELLRMIAARIKRAVRDSDCVGRIGGDEFVIVLSDIHDVMEVSTIRKRVVAGIEEPVILNGMKIFPQTSIGWGFSPNDGTSPGELLKVADAMMYEHKRIRHAQRSASCEQLSARTG